MRSFLGLAGYYWKFVNGYSRIAAPLTDLTKAKQPNKIKWNDEAIDAFNQLKQALTSLNRLSYAQTLPTLGSEQWYVKSVTKCCSLSHLRARTSAKAIFRGGKGMFGNRLGKCCCTG